MYKNYSEEINMFTPPNHRGFELFREHRLLWKQIPYIEVLPETIFEELKQHNVKEAKAMVEKAPVEQRKSLLERIKSLQEYQNMNEKERAQITTNLDALRKQVEISAAPRLQDQINTIISPQTQRNVMIGTATVAGGGATGGLIYFFARLFRKARAMEKAAVQKTKSGIIKVTKLLLFAGAAVLGGSLVYIGFRQGG